MELTILILVSVLLTISSFFLSTIGCICVFATYLALNCCYFFFLKKRREKLKELSVQLDRLLHEGIQLPISDYCEGELSILANQLQKVTLRLQEGAEQSQSDKLALAQSLADISHQLRTPLTAIYLTAAMLREPGLSEQRRLELSRELQNLLSRTDWLVDTLLKLSKLDAGTVELRREQVPVRELIDRAAAPLSIPIELRELQLIVSCTGEDLTADPVWTAEAIGNLLKNAMEHTPSGGTITVTAQQTALYTAITVEDTGCGFDEADLPHLFERFYKGKNASESCYGIGLALARTIIAAQNGTIQAMNTETGAKFLIKFYHQVL